MTKTFENFFIQNKKTLIQKISENKKCERDLDFLLTAMFYDLIKGSKEHTVRHASKFWHRGTLQIKSLESKLPVYNELRILLKQMLTDNNFVLEAEQIDGLFDINELVLREGSMLEGHEKIWQDRRNFTKFLTDVDVPQYLENHLDTCIQETPVQIRNYTAICKLTKADQEIKDFLVQHYLISPQGNHMIAVSTAPLVYISLYLDSTGENDGRAFDKVVNIHGGVMLAETLRHGYDFSFIGCGVDNVSSEVTESWKNMIKDRFGITPSSESPWPVICWCIGKGDETYTTNTVGLEYELSNKYTVPSQVFMTKNISKKERILYQ